MTVVDTTTQWPDTADALRSLLQIDSGPKLQCHGTTLKKSKCRRPLSKQTAQSILALLREIVDKGDFFAAKSLLERLAFQALCVLTHQKCASQIEEVMKKWETILSKLTVTAVKEEEEEPEYDSEDATEATAELEVPSVVQASGPVKREIKEEKVKLEEPELMDIEQIPTPAATPEKPKRVRPKTKKTTTKKKKPKHVFERYGPPQSTYQMNRTIKLVLEKPMSTDELKKHASGKTGYIYLYTFPDNYRDKSPLIKIGYTTDLDKRMSRWSRECGYDPKLIGHFDTEHYVKVEKVVHSHMVNQRRREIQCPVCSVPHKEWFDVKLRRASGIIGLWVEWIRKEPYDEAGVLKPQWRERLQRVDLEDPECWDSFVEDDYDEEEEEEEEDDEEEEEEEDEEDVHDDSGYWGSEYDEASESSDCEETDTK